MKSAEQFKAAKEFVKRWQGKGYEKGESQKFWIDLLMNVYGIEQPTQYMEFEKQIMLEHTSFIDVYIPETKVIIEQKSIGKDLKKAIKQSDGTLLSTMQQMQRYANAMNYDEMPRWGISCNFQEFMIFDFNNKHGEPELVKLEDLPKEYHRLSFLVAKDTTHIRKEVEISVEAGKIVSRIYDELRKGYKTDDEDTLRQLNILCVRLIFCLYAEDAGIFSKDQFYKYMRPVPTTRFRQELISLFEVLNTPYNERDEYMIDDLAAFPYVNGGLFAEKIVLPRFSVETVEYILEEASLGFNWKPISPTIFGAVFESTLSTKLRRAGGMHYTSIENIHKVIDPLFLDELQHEFDNIMEMKQIRSRKNLLKQFQAKLANLTFLDPACGSGNFLTETYISLRRLENKVVMALQGDNVQLDLAEEYRPIQVSISQFYGIEINDFAVSVAKTALWIAEYQMMEETRQIIDVVEDFLPLKSYANIVEGNALRLDWHEVVPADKLDYIMGNPPFVGYAYQNKEQKNELSALYTSKNIDYVAGWYYKASYLMSISDKIKTAFVSTNSITQGEQVCSVWKPLYDKFEIHIDFAWRTFKWASEASEQAAVHVVIVGFSKLDRANKRKLYDDGNILKVDNINPYLASAPDMFIIRRTKPLCNVPEMIRGSQPTDNGNLIFTAAEKESFIKAYPKAVQFIRPFMMGKDFIDRTPRFCLWLDGVSPKEYSSISGIMKRLEQVKEFRLKSTKAATRKKADTPMLFDEIRDSKTDYIAVPKVSSENRKYIPIDYLKSDIIAGDKLFMISDATIYIFGVIISNIHMEWMRTVAGRLKSDYSYSNTIVYNNFPWPAPTDRQKVKIEKTAQAILDARTLYPDCSLAELYNDLTMPPELRKAHQANDKAVMEAYGFIKQVDGKATWYSPSECVAALMKMYQALVKGKKT